MTLVDAAFDDILKQMHQDELYAATLHNEVDGVCPGAWMGIPAKRNVRFPISVTFFTVIKTILI